LRRLPHIHHFTRFAHEERHPGIRMHLISRPLAAPRLRCELSGDAARGNFMTFYHSERQGNLWGCCPNNTGSSRQFGGYCPVIPTHIVLIVLGYHNYLRFCILRPCTQGRLSFEISLITRTSYFSWQICFVLLPLGRPEASYRITNASDATPPQIFYHVLSSDSDFHRASTRFFVASSIKISSGHGRIKPSDVHLRVASIPIFDPKSCIRAA
jgi:hypothetical protein